MYKNYCLQSLTNTKLLSWIQVYLIDVYHIVRNWYISAYIVNMRLTIGKTKHLHKFYLFIYFLYAFKSIIKFSNWVIFYITKTNEQMFSWYGYSSIFTSYHTINKLCWLLSLLKFLQTPITLYFKMHKSNS